jgi:hypothetical protein
LDATSDAADSRRRQDPWGTAALLLGAGYAVVVLATAAIHAGRNWSAAPATITVPASRMELARGAGRRAGEVLVVDPFERGGLAVVSARTIPFPAGAYPRVEWNVQKAVALDDVSLSLLWVTREQPGRTFSKPIPWPGTGAAVVELSDEEGWRGSVSGVALAVRGTLTQPLAVASVTIPGVSVPTVVAEIGRQWATFFPFRGISITLPFDEERTNHVSLLAATAMALGLAALAWLLAARWRKRAFDARVLWIMLVACWLILDLRWQANLGWQLGQTWRQFAGKSLEDKYLASVDHELYALIRKVNEVLPPPPARVFFLTDSYPLRMRGSWFFYPRNVYHDLAQSAARTPEPDQLRAGDHVVSFLHTGLAYDREGKALVWPDGRRKAVVELLYQDPGPIVLRVP